jgi:hypothetical protein
MPISRGFTGLLVRNCQGFWIGIPGIGCVIARTPRCGIGSSGSGAWTSRFSTGACRGCHQDEISPRRRCRLSYSGHRPVRRNRGECRRRAVGIGGPACPFAVERWVPEGMANEFQHDCCIRYGPKTPPANPPLSGQCTVARNSLWPDFAASGLCRSVAGCRMAASSLPAGKTEGPVRISKPDLLVCAPLGT